MHFVVEAVEQQAGQRRVDVGSMCFIKQGNKTEAFFSTISKGIFPLYDGNDSHLVLYFAC